MLHCMELKSMVDRSCTAHVVYSVELLHHMQMEPVPSAAVCASMLRWLFIYLTVLTAPDLPKVVTHTCCCCCCWLLLLLLLPGAG
jgi:hypothetical protein